MTEKRFEIEMGVTIIQSGLLPQIIENEATGELETVHMIQKGNAIYVSQELYSALDKRRKNKEDESNG